jgi:hypothetical protein
VPVLDLPAQTHDAHDTFGPDARDVGMPARKSTEDKLSELDEQIAGSDPATRIAALKAALADRHYRVVAKSAALAAERLAYELVPDLLAAYPRFVEQPVKRDPGCFAKKAITRALVNLECAESSFFVAGLRYRQPEPVWGGTVDTAVDVRSSCAMGLVATGHPRSLVELTELLNDKEAPARAGAVRAIACGNPREAELLLRAKALAGDAEPGVIGECFTGLLNLEPDESPAFVARFLASAGQGSRGLSDDEALRELAALALGESRLDAALEHLRAAWDEAFQPRDFRRVLIRAAAIHRSEAAFSWLVSLIADRDAATAADVVETLAMYRHNARLAARVEETVARRADAGLAELFAGSWRAAPPRA